MTIRNFDAQIIMLDGVPVMKPDKTPFILRDEIVSLLSTTFPDEANLHGAEKFERGQLAVKVNAGGDIDFTEPELQMLKKVIGRGSIPVVHQAFKILNGE